MYLSKLPAVITSLDSTLATRDVIAVRRLVSVILRASSNTNVLYLTMGDYLILRNTKIWHNK